MKYAFVLFLIATAAQGQTMGAKTVSFSSYVADNFRILSKVKKNVPQVAFQETAPYRAPANVEESPAGKSSNMGFGTNGKNTSQAFGAATGNLIPKNDNAFGLGNSNNNSNSANTNSNSAPPAPTPSDSSTAPSGDGQSK